MSAKIRISGTGSDLSSGLRTRWGVRPRRSLPPGPGGVALPYDRAGSAILQSSRRFACRDLRDCGVRPLCQVLVAIQILDAARARALNAVANDLLKRLDPGSASAGVFDALWEQIEAASTSEVARLLQGQGVVRKLEEFLTAETAVSPPATSTTS